MGKKLLLFDVDGTLTKPRLCIDTKMVDVLKNLYNNKNIDYFQQNELNQDEMNQEHSFKQISNQ